MKAHDLPTRWPKESVGEICINIFEGAFSILWETIILSNEFHDGIKVPSQGTGITAETMAEIRYHGRQEVKVRSFDAIHSYKVRRFDATYPSKERNVTSEL